MKLRLTLAIFLGIINSLGGRASDDVLLGCPNLKSMAEALSKIEQGDWRQISLSQVQALWPSHLDGMDCNANTCTSVWHRGRIIDGHCECCTAFYFDNEPISGEPSGSLNSIIISHSTPNRKKALDAAITLCTAVGLPKQYIASLGNESMQDFSWENNRKQQRELTMLEVRISRNKSLWELYIYIGRFIMEQTGVANRGATAIIDASHSSQNHRRENFPSQGGNFRTPDTLR